MPDALRGRTEGDAAAGCQPRRDIRRLFVANRGEIARRIARTAERMAIEPVVAHDADPDLDLLDSAAVVHAAKAAGADALHPGYGFLSENPAFAETVEAAGLAWVGPPPGAMAAMGDKAGARRLAASLGVPVLPGYDGDEQSDERLVREAERVGYPVLVKPSAGGGGKGMRPVLEPASLVDSLAAARREANAAFGDTRLILERLLRGPRHVEVQVLFGADGVGLALGERDCSLQRRHQKVLEESPSPGVGDELRARLNEAAVLLAEAVRYRSVGTVEFLVDDEGGFFFLEMNTRLQVEHPVTELVTGRDLVADQLRVACGAPLAEVVARMSPGPPGLETSDEPARHAVEVRLYAEDPEAGFLPSTGRVELVNWPAPASGEGSSDGGFIRIDAGIEAGTVVGGRFDPLLAKVIAGGATRSEALARLTTALDQTVVLGLTTNLRFLRWLVRRPEVLAGEARIDTIERTWRPSEMGLEIPQSAWELAARALLRDSVVTPGAPPARAATWGGGWRMSEAARARLAAGDLERVVRLPSAPAGFDGPVHAIAGDTVHVDVEGRSLAFRLAPPPDVERAIRAHAVGGSGQRSEIHAPMPGSVLAVHAAAGSDVEAGDAIATLEAMKMEHTVTAPGRGRVAEVLVTAGEQVTRGQLLVLLEDSA